MRILLSLVIVAVGITMVIGTESVLRMFGRSGFAEKLFRTSGGTRMWYKAIGVGAIFIGFMIMMNMHTGIMEWIARTLFGAYVPQDQAVTEEYYEVR